MEQANSHLNIKSDEELELAVAKELEIKDPDNAIELIGLQADQVNLIDPEILKQIESGIPIEELGRRI